VLPVSLVVGLLVVFVIDGKSNFYTYCNTQGGNKGTTLMGSVGCKTLVYVVQRMGVSRRVIGNKVLYLHEVLTIGTLFPLLFSFIGLGWFSIHDLSFSRNNRSGNEDFVRQ
jgi:hypothetical protein